MNKNNSNLNIEQEFRCPKCFLIPFIKIIPKKNNFSIKSNCTNNHSFEKTFNQFQILLNQNKNKLKCSICEKKFFSNDLFYYCSNCFNFYCMNDGENHKMKEKHKIILNNKFDSLCSEHEGNSLIGYCEKHNKNYCFYCSHFKENNNKNFDDFNENEIKNFENQMKINEKEIKNLVFMFNNAKKNFKEFENNFFVFKDNFLKKIKFMNEIIQFYKKKKHENNINFQMVANIKNNIFNLNIIKQSILNKINNFIKEINEITEIISEKEDSKK